MTRLQKDIDGMFQLFGMRAVHTYEETVYDGKHFYVTRQRPHHRAGAKWTVHERRFSKMTPGLCIETTTFNHYYTKREAVEIARANSERRQQNELS